MTPQRFKRLALSLPGSTEKKAATRLDFQVAEHTYATLFPGDGWGVIRLTSELQSFLTSEQPDVFAAAKGAWGRHGATIILLDNAEEGTVLRALIDAWRKHAPSALQADIRDPPSS